MKERYEDALERIRLIPAERTTAEPFCSFFRETAEFLLQLDHWYRRFEQEDILHTKDIAGLREMNAALYGPLLQGGKLAAWLDAAAFDGAGCAGEACVTELSPLESRGLCSSKASDTLAAKAHNGHPSAKLPLSPLCSALLRELTALIPAVCEKRETRITAALELFIQIYCLYEEAFALTRSPLRHPREKTVHDVFYSYFYDYSEEMQEEDLRENFDPRGSYLQRFLLTADTASSEYLYRSGEYVSPVRLQRFAETQALPETAVEAQLRQWREQLGISSETRHLHQSEAGGRKPYVRLWATPGRERLYQALARSLRDEGIGITMPRAARGILMAVPEKRFGYYESPNPRTDRLHDYDLALLMGDRLTSRLLEERRHLLASLAREGNVCIGVLRDLPADTQRVPEDETEGLRLRFTEHQNTVYRDYCQKAEALTRTALMENGTAEEAEHETTLL